MASNVLIVDDEPALREIIAEALAAEGYCVTTAVDGAQALRSLHERRPELIMLDLMMPVLDGWAFIDAYREMAEGEIPIIGVSANMTPNVAARLGKLGVRVCLAKPFDLDELIACAKNLLGSTAPVHTPRHLPSACAEDGKDQQGSREHDENTRGRIRQDVHERAIGVLTHDVGVVHQA